VSTPTNLHLYDLLDVAPDASEAEIKAAWKAAISELDPTDRRFRLYNQAAEVLLDRQQRAAYDAELAARAQAEETAHVDGPTDGPTDGPGDTHDSVGLETAATAPSAGPSVATARTGVPTWALAVLAVVTAVAVGVAAWQWTQDSDASVEESTRAAQSAAERAVVPILSYNALHLDEDQKTAQTYMTSDYREKSYDKLFAVIKQNAPGTKTIVKTEVIGSGIVRSGADRVQVLLFINRPTTNKQLTEPVVYKDQVTVTMQLVDGDWLVDDMVTSPVAN
jgi:Mce-associated membrane protein